MSFDKVFTEKWGETPKGEFYDAYMLVKNYRDMLQKALWMSKNNPNTDKVISALIAMLNDEGAVASINKSVGDYDWFIGSDLLNAVNYLNENNEHKTKEYLIKWQTDVLGYKAIIK